MTNPEFNDAEGIRQIPTLLSVLKGRRKSVEQKQVFQLCLVVQRISVSSPLYVGVKWKNFDFEMRPRVQQKASLINYQFMKLILILDSNSFLYLILL